MKEEKFGNTVNDKELQSAKKHASKSFSENKENNGHIEENTRNQRLYLRWPTTENGQISFGKIGSYLFKDLFTKT